MMIFGSIIAVIGFGWIIYMVRMAPKGTQTDEGFRREKQQ